MTNTLLINANKKNVSVLSLLDLSAAFDTLDHQILVRRLKTTHGISGPALTEFSSDHSGPSQSVVCNHMLFKTSTLKYSVSQCSVSGSRLFALYTQPLSEVIKQNDSNYRKYANDGRTEQCS